MSVRGVYSRNKRRGFERTISRSHAKGYQGRCSKSGMMWMVGERSGSLRRPFIGCLRSLAIRGMQVRTFCTARYRTLRRPRSCRPLLPSLLFVRLRTGFVRGVVSTPPQPWLSVAWDKVCIEITVAQWCIDDGNGSLRVAKECFVYTLFFPRLCRVCNSSKRSEDAVRSRKHTINLILICTRAAVLLVKLSCRAVALDSRQMLE